MLKGDEECLLGPNLNNKVYSHQTSALIFIISLAFPVTIYLLKQEQYFYKLVIDCNITIANTIDLLHNLKQKEFMFRQFFLIF
ncbi:hypothetical protein DN208_24685 [Salmonella enterica subsp. enterica serovar Soerenga]|nr:hypothetical protein [Salmonella enterica subsp. enterica serovar Soerenga]EBX0106557.1 hypothetical protein [Salmonella enterica subsp. enterica serovar Stanley]